MVSADIELYKQGESGQSGVTGVFLGVTPAAVQFKVNVTSGDPTAFHWDFGDGTTSDFREPTHTYAFYGTYRVELTVSDAIGQYVSPFFVLRLGKLDFLADYVMGIKPLTVHFTNQNVAPSGCCFTGAIWDFGDGSTGMVDNPTHVYSENGKYSVRIDAVITNV